MTSPELPREQLAPEVVEYLEISTRLLIDLGAAAILKNYADYSHRIYEWPPNRIGSLPIPAEQSLQARDEQHLKRVDAFIGIELPLAINVTNTRLGSFIEGEFVNYVTVNYSLVKVDQKGWIYDGDPDSMKYPHEISLFTTGLKDRVYKDAYWDSAGVVTAELVNGAFELIKAQEAIGWSPLDHKYFPGINVNKPSTG
jgi:hypothetical protein